MPVHDAYARRTPFEVLLPAPEFADERFPALEEEARRREIPLVDPGVMLLLESGVELLQELRDPGQDPAEGYPYGALLFHAFHFWRAGRPLFLLDTPAFRRLVAEGPGAGEWSPRPPGAAGYVQLPQHILWAVGGEGSVPESVDGFFWSVPDPDHFSVLVVMGMRRDRPGVSVVPLPPLPLRTVGEWAVTTVRPGGGDFTSSLPGAELEGLHAVETAGEILKLAARVFWYLDVRPGAVTEGAPGEGDEGEPPPSGLPYRRVGAPAPGTDEGVE